MASLRQVQGFSKTAQGAWVVHPLSRTEVIRYMVTWWWSCFWFDGPEGPKLDIQAVTPVQRCVLRKEAKQNKTRWPVSLRGHPHPSWRGGSHTSRPASGPVRSTLTCAQAHKHEFESEPFSSGVSPSSQPMVNFAWKVDSPLPTQVEKTGISLVPRHSACPI